MHLPPMLRPADGRPLICRPRPNPCAGLETVKNTPNMAMAGQKKWVKLAAAILIDVVGVASFALPGAGEVRGGPRVGARLDLLWARGVGLW